MTHNTLDYLDDLEIYLDNAELETLIGWLSTELSDFQTHAQSRKGCKFRFTHNGQAGEGMIVLNAGRTGFTSIWLNTRHAPWEHDVAFGRAAFAALGSTVRCNESAWSKGDDPDRWLQIAANGEHLITWKTEEP